MKSFPVFKLMVLCSQLSFSMTGASSPRLWSDLVGDTRAYCGLVVWDTVLLLLLVLIVMFKVRRASCIPNCTGICKSKVLKASKHRFLKSPNLLLHSFWLREPTIKVTGSRPADCGWGSIPMPLTFISVMNWLSTGTQSMEFGGRAGCVCLPSAALLARWPVNHLAISLSCQAHRDVTFNCSALMQTGVSSSTPQTHASLWQMYILQMKL